MYNNEIKEEFLETRTPIMRETAKHIFNTTEKYESSFNKDVSNFTTAEITMMYKGIFSPSLDYINNINTQLTIYTRYMLSRNLVSDKQNHYEEFDFKILNTFLNQGYINQAIISRSELLKILHTNNEDIKNPSEKFLILGLFEGLDGQGHSDFWELSLNDFKDDGVHVVRGKNENEREVVIPVSDELRSFAEESANEYTYYMYGDNDDGRHLIRRYNDYDNRIIKSYLPNTVDTPASNRIRIHRMVKKIAENTGMVTFKAQNLRESGRIEMIKQLHKEGEEWRDTILNNRTRIEDIYGKFSSGSVSKYLTRFSRFFEDQ